MLSMMLTSGGVVGSSSSTAVEEDIRGVLSIEDETGAFFLKVDPFLALLGPFDPATCLSFL
jgi:hypothetical protein